MQDIVPFIQQHMALSVGLIVVLTLLVIVEFIRLKQSGSQLSAPKVTDMINHQGAVVVDIRSQDSFNNGHLVDAVSLPASELPNKLKKLDKHKAQPIILVCETGTESLHSATLLAKEGFNVFTMAGGIRAWRLADMPLVKG